jgi:hypothetical protein
LTACPLFIGLTACPLHFLSRLRVLYLPWADFVPLPSSVGFVSTTSPCADTASTASHTVNYNVRPRALPKPRAPPKSRVPYNIEQRVYDPFSYRQLHLLPSVCRLLVRVDYLSSRQLLLISTSFGSTVCCSKYLQVAGYGPLILGRCRPTHSYATRESGPQETSGGNFGHASPKSRLLMARIGSSIVSRTLHTFDPET